MFTIIDFSPNESIYGLLSKSISGLVSLFNFLLRPIGSNSSAKCTFFYTFYRRKSYTRLFVILKGSANYNDWYHLCMPEIWILETFFVFQICSSYFIDVLIFWISSMCFYFISLEFYFVLLIYNRNSRSRNQKSHH